jgi:outer membrane protein
MIRRIIVIITFVTGTLPLALRAQSSPDTLVHLKDALILAEQKYHLLKAKKAEADAATKSISVVKYSVVPSLDISYQAGIGTANNLTGIFYPNGILPMTGPPSNSNNYTPASGSAASVLLNWQALTFGERNAQINVSETEAKGKVSEYQQTLFYHKLYVINAYLDLLLSKQSIAIYEHNLERANVNLKQGRVLVMSGIRPGVDTALFLSEVSKGKIDWLNAKKQLKESQSILARLIVVNSYPVPADTTFLNTLPVFNNVTDSSFASNPTMQYEQSQIELNRSREMLLRKSNLPKLNVWGTGFARGSGFGPDGIVKTWNGMGLSRYNYGAGVQLIFSIFKSGDIKRRLSQQRLLTKAAQEKAEESKSTLISQQQIADATYSSSLAIAEETGEQLNSAQYAFAAMQTRYKTGLVNLSDLIQTQYNLLKAELDKEKSYWDVWKSLLLQAMVKGDENIILNAIR